MMPHCDRRVLNVYDPIRPLDEGRVAESRNRVSQYFETLVSAGLSGADRQVEYGIAYLKELHGGHLCSWRAFHGTQFREKPIMPLQCVAANTSVRDAFQTGHVCNALAGFLLGRETAAHYVALPFAS
jgi:hypothetical protein